jgi:hypothetical protein
MRGQRKRNQRMTGEKTAAIVGLILLLTKKT